MPRKNCSNSGAKTADGLPHVQPRHVHSNSQRTRLALMPVGNQRQGGRNIKRFTHPHHRTQPIQLMKIISISHQIRHARPNKKTAYNQPFTVNTIGNHTGNRTHKTVNPQENSHQRTKCFRLIQLHYINLHRFLHSREHLTIHIIKQSHHPKQRYYNPRIYIFVFHNN